MVDYDNIWCTYEKLISDQLQQNTEDETSNFCVYCNSNSICEDFLSKGYPSLERKFNSSIICSII